MKTDNIQLNGRKNETVISPSLSLYTGTLCTSLDVGRLSRRLVIATTQTNTQPTTQEVDSGVSCQCPRIAVGAAATETPRMLGSRRTAPMGTAPTRAKDNSSP